MASNHWEDPDNWSPAGYPSGAGDTAEFDALSQTCVQTEPETVGTLTVKGAQQSGKIESEEPLTVDGGSMDSGTIAIDSAGSLNIAAGEFDMSGGAILMGQGLLAQGVSPNGGAGTQLIHVLSHTTYKLTNGETIGVGILNDGTVACNGCTATFVGQTNLTNRTGAFVNLLGANLNVSNLASTGEIDNSGIVYLYTGTTTSYLPVTNETGSSLELQSGDLNIKGYIGGTTLGGPSVQQEGGTTTIYAGQTLTVAGGYRQDGGTLQTRDNGLQTVAKIAGDVQINVGSVKVACVAGTYGSLSVLAGSGSGDLTMAKGTILYLAVNVPTGGVIPGSDYSSINAAGSVNVDSSLGTVLSVTTTGGANVVAGTSKWVAVHSGAAFNDQFNPNWNGGYAWTLTINRTDDDVSATKPPSRAEPLAPPSQALDLGQGNIPSMPSSNLGATEASEADAIFAVIVPGTRLFFGPALTEWTRGNVGPAAPNPDQPTPLQDAMILRFER